MNKKRSRRSASKIEVAMGIGELLLNYAIEGSKLTTNLS
jgi:hypothetical protein